ncbi:MAG: KGK domain-containing protein [Crinalium sp.]
MTMDYDDVVHFLDGEDNPCQGLTAKSSEIVAAFNSRTFNDDIWVTSGVECEILNVLGGGWKKGKVRLRLEFVPDHSNNAKEGVVLSDLDRIRNELKAT